MKIENTGEGNGRGERKTKRREERKRKEKKRKEKKRKVKRWKGIREKQKNNYGKIQYSNNN